MSCLRNFSLAVDTSITFNTPNVTIDSWGIPNTNTFVINEPFGDSNLVINSSKSLDVYGIELNGNVSSSLGTFNGILEDYGFEVEIGGLVPTIGFEFTVNTYGATLRPNSYRVTKYIPKVTFEAPVSGCRLVRLRRLFGAGRNLDTLNSFSADVNLIVTIYYKFEGE
jgi:hypothetical protein